MPDFISKLQHKYYEKGEYSDEKARSLEDTLQLIKDFSWDQERGVDIQLTCPSVVIQDEYANYLKAAIYFNGKYCLYYFDCDHHLYEYHTADLKDVYEMVTEFFNGQIELQKFEKHTLSIGTLKHFESVVFDYTINNVRFYLQIIPIVLVIGTTIYPISQIISSGDTFQGIYFFFIFFFLWESLLGYFIYSMIKVYRKSKDMYLNISSGNNTFKFGDGEVITDYNKKDIALINIYGKPGSSTSLNIIEVNFNNGTQINFPTLLIPPMTFIAKFNDQTKYEYIINTWQRNSALWKY